MSLSPKMPISRDISVKNPSLPDAEQEELLESRSSPNMVTVMGFDKNDVLFRSDSVGTVQWRDTSGEIVALLVRLRPDIWGFSKRGDDDWPEVLKMYGNPDAE